ncbi:MATE family efflux transporter [Ignatzschineria rhizosphaerae]|uniref:Multidrug export protein MepA n=1 Tax=Ignatzschineria rhizosphaerae TaxID=2923279 RepID=A0ABY3X5G0_9GAMM|nr:MATE family efflux transporter [Ignatzschineria rhizosphaerae]UNM95986.1 MATE family efflux transporter [Ignatzschineria rhizosphaerae]
MRRYNVVLIKLFASYVVPTVLAMFISGTYQIVDGFFVGHFIGVNGLAAVNIGWSYITLLLGFGFLVGVGIGSLYSISKGEDDDEKARKILGQALFLQFIPGILIGLILYFSSPWLVYVLGISGSSAEMAIIFIQTFSFAAPFVIGSLAMPFIVRNVGTPLRATGYIAAGVVVNILLSYFLISYLRVGVVGAALASIGGEIVAMTLGGYFVLKQSREKLSWQDFKPDFKLIGAILLTGSSAFFTFIYIGFIMTLHHKVLVEYGGTVAVSAYTIAGYLLTIYYFAVEGVANGAQPLISRFYGEERVRSTRYVTRLMVYVGLGIGMIITASLLLFPEFFTSWFTDDPELKSVTAYALRLHLAVLFLDGLFVTATMFFQAIGEGQKALVISIGNLLLQVPFLFILPKYWGLDGVWLTMPIATVILAIPVAWMFYSRYQRITDDEFLEDEVLVAD